jgi:hypothetical protein
MHQKETLNGFDLDNHSLLDNEVEAVNGSQHLVFVNDGNLNLSSELESCFSQLPGKTFAISGFE